MKTAICTLTKALSSCAAGWVNERMSVGGIWSVTTEALVTSARLFSMFSGGVDHFDKTTDHIINSLQT